MSIDLKGRIALITGAGAGFGRSISYALADSGAHVLLNDIAIERIKELEKRIVAAGGQATAMPADISSEKDIRAMFKAISDKFKRLDFAVNNAGIDIVSEFTDFPIKDFDKVMDINTRGVFLCCQEELKMMIPAAKGRIINISSVCGFKGYSGQSAYVASKHAVHGLSKCLALEGQKHGISVSVISPGAANTELGRKNNPSLELSTLLSPEDIAKTVLYLLSLSDTAMVDEVYVRRKVDIPF